MKRWILGFLILVAAAAFVFLAWQQFFASPAAEPLPKPVPVTIPPLSDQEVEYAKDASGRIISTPANINRFFETQQPQP